MGAVVLFLALASAILARPRPSSRSLQGVPAWAQFPRRVERHLSATAEPIPVDAPTVVLPGGGLFFYWQAGALRWLAKNRHRIEHPEQLRFAGASAGALAALLAVNEVDMDAAVTSALNLAKEAEIWERPLGLAGVWGDLIEGWLEDLLPEGALANSNGKLCIFLLRVRCLGLVSPLLKPRHKCFTEFATREELITASVGSAHLPMFLNGRATRRFRGKKYIDGSFRLTEARMLELTHQALSPSPLAAAAASEAGSDTEGDDEEPGLLGRIARSRERRAARALRTKEVQAIMNEGPRELDEEDGEIAGPMGTIAASKTDEEPPAEATMQLSLPAYPRTVVFDFQLDAEMLAVKDTWLKLRSPEELWDMVDQGERWAERNADAILATLNAGGVAGSKDLDTEERAEQGASLSGARKVDSYLTDS